MEQLVRKVRDKSKRPTPGKNCKMNQNQHVVTGRDSGLDGKGKERRLQVVRCVLGGAGKTGIEAAATLPLGGHHSPTLVAELTHHRENTYQQKDIPAVLTPSNLPTCI